MLADGATGPTSSQVAAGNDAGGFAALFAASVTVPAAATTATISVTSGVVPSTHYDVFVVAKDATAGANMQAMPVKVDVETAADATAPVFLASFPNVANVVDLSFNVNVQLDEAGTFYVVVLANAASAPSAAQVKAGQDSTGSSPLFAGSVAVAAADTTATVTVDSGVVASTE